MSTDEWREVEWPKRNIERLDEKIQQVLFLLDEMIKRVEIAEDRIGAMQGTTRITHDRLSSLEGWPTKKPGSTKPIGELRDGVIHLDPEHPTVKDWIEKHPMPVAGFSGLKRGFENGTIRPSTGQRAFTKKLIEEAWVDPACGHTRTGDDRDGPCPMHPLRTEDERITERLQLAVNGGTEFVLALAERRVREHMKGAFSEWTIDTVCNALRGSLGTSAMSSAKRRQMADDENSALHND